MKPIIAAYGKLFTLYEKFFKIFCYIVLITLAGFTFNSCAVRYVDSEPYYESHYERPPRPGESHIWIEGDWLWQRDSHQYVHEPGHWETPREGREYQEGHWESSPKGKYWVKGYWYKQGHDKDKGESKDHDRDRKSDNENNDNR
jgi:hypothetical protein